MSIRPAGADDAGAIAALYAPFVTATAISLELAPPDAAEIAARIAGGGLPYPWFLAEQDGGVAGYAYASAFKPREGYRHTAEVSVYVADIARRRGLAAGLYDALMPALAARGVRQAIATITLPNPSSVAFHERAGFVAAGMLTGVGRKFDRWHDVGLWQRGIG